jgi:hypothetical protein
VSPSRTTHKIVHARQEGAQLWSPSFSLQCLFKTTSARIDPHGAGWTLHQLRHSALQHLAQAGRTASELQAKSRHAHWPASGCTYGSVSRPPPASPPNTTRPHAAVPTEHPLTSPLPPSGLLGLPPGGVPAVPHGMLAMAMIDDGVWR